MPSSPTSTLARNRPALAPALMMLLAAGCGSEAVDENGDGVDDGIVTPNNVSVVTPTTPRGFVAGRVLDATTQAPLAGVTVVLFGGGVRGDVLTDDTGTFQFGPIASGARVALTYTARGFASANLEGITIDDAAGNFPLDNGAAWVGSIALIPTRGAVTLQVVSELGSPVEGAQVALESGVRFFSNERATGTLVARGTSNADGQVTLEGLPDVWALPPSAAGKSGPFVANVAPIDADGDGRPELLGTTRALEVNDLRTGAAPAVLVLPTPDRNQPLQILASNVTGLLDARARPSVLEVTAPIRVVFNQVIDQASALAVVANEKGDDDLPVNLAFGALGNVLEVRHDTSFQSGQEYNLVLQVQTSASSPPQSLRVLAPFFAARDPGDTVRVSGSFSDNNNDNLWGNANDRVEINFDVPLGFSARNPAFKARIWLDIDLNSSGTIGDATGELPALGDPYPSPILRDGAEPVPMIGGARSGFTTIIAPINVTNLMTPLGPADGPRAIEVRLEAADNQGFVADPSGRAVRAALEGSVQLR